MMGSAQSGAHINIMCAAAKRFLYPLAPAALKNTTGCRHCAAAHFSAAASIATYVWNV